MIREISVELQTELRAAGCPLSVIYDEVTTTATNGRERIVMVEDETGGDRFKPARSQRAYPRHVLTRAIGVKLTIYAQSSKAGAQTFEHRRRASHILDLVLVAMATVASKRKNSWEPTGGRFTKAADLEASERIGGAVYELSFLFDRGVFEQKWNGDTVETFEVAEGLFENRTDVSLANGPTGGPVVTGCGS